MDLQKRLTHTVTHTRKRTDGSSGNMGAKEYFNSNGNGQKHPENDIFRIFLLFVISRSGVRVRLPAPIFPQRSKVNMGEFPSGQRGQTVNLLSVTSVVRIHLPPPNSALKDAEFCFILSTFRTILCIFIKAAPDRTRQFSGANRCCFLFFSLFLTARRGQSQLACCLSLRDIDANPDANGDGTKRAWLDKMR